MSGSTIVKDAPTPPTFKRKIILFLAVVGPLAATVYAIFRLWNDLVSWRDLAILGGMYAATVTGIGVGYHRMLTHRGFEASTPVRAFWLILGCMALQGPPLSWAATHLKHHAKADHEGDPHSPVEGFFHAHLGWLFREKLTSSGVWTKPYESDPVVKFVTKTELLWTIMGFAIPFALGGWTGLLWGGAVRIFLVHHVTWSVNSVCHTFGSRPFDTHDQSRNEPIVGLLGFGEGWHNNHHASPQSAIHGFRWYQFDLNGMVIRTMARLRIIWNVRRPPKELDSLHGQTPEPI